MDLFCLILSMATPTLRLFPFAQNIFFHPFILCLCVFITLPHPELFHPPHSVMLFIFYLFFVFLGPHLWHMEVPRLGVESEL